MASSGSECPDAPLRVEGLRPGIAAITLYRPSGPNVIDETLCDALVSACDRLAGDASLHAVLLRAHGPAFCVGADLAALQQTHADDLHGHIERLIDHAHPAILALRRMPIPVIACVHAAAAGGGFSLAMACDQVMAAAPARFVAAYPALGASPDCGLTHTLAGRVGPRKALDLVIDTRPLEACQALSLGVVDEIAEGASLDDTALATALRLCGVPRPALVQAKALFLREDLPQLASRLDQEKAAFLRCADTPEFRERLRAFNRDRRSG